MFYEEDDVAPPAVDNYLHGMTYGQWASLVGVSWREYMVDFSGKEYRRRLEKIYGKTEEAIDRYLRLRQSAIATADALFSTFPYARPIPREEIGFALD